MWGGGGYWLFGRGGVPRWGGLRATHYYHMHTSKGDVCLGVLGYGGMYVKALGTALEQGKSSKCRIFTTNDICIAARLANLPLKAWMV